MATEYLNNTGLAYFWSKIKAWCNSLFALDNTVVHKVGNETIAGTKTFSSTITGSIDGNAATATKLGTSDVGAISNPIYLKDGLPTATGNSLNKTIVNYVGNGAYSDIVQTQQSENNN